MADDEEDAPPAGELPEGSSNSPAGEFDWSNLGAILTWAPRGARSAVTVRGGGTGKVNIAAVACFRPGDRPHLLYRLRSYRRRKGERKAFTWTDYRDLIIAARRELAGPVVWVWDSLPVHLARELADFASQNEDWLRVYRLPAYAPELNPVEMSLSQCEFRRAYLA